MKIRKARKEDYLKIANLRKKTFERINGKNYSKEQVDFINSKNPPKIILEKMKQRDMFCLVDKDKILGVIDLEGNKIGGLFVRYNYLGNGLGKKLLTFMEDYAKKKNIKKVILYSTEYAYKFYLKQGYKFVESGKWGPKETSDPFLTHNLEKRLK